jgi:putative DNA primase/helicase
MVQGAVRWHTEGLSRPEAVLAAALEWREDVDQIGRFISEQCIEHKAAETKARALYSVYRKWIEEAGEKPVTETSFGSTLKQRGFEKRHTNKGAIYQGIGLRAPCDQGDG